MVQRQVFLKGGKGGWNFSFLIFSRFIIFTFRNYFINSSSAAGCSQHQQPTSGASCSWWWLLYVEMRVWTSASVAMLTSGVSCSWWGLCYMSKCTCGQVLVFPSQRLVHPAADDDFLKLLYSFQNCVIHLKKKNFFLPP